MIGAFTTRRASSFFHPPAAVVARAVGAQVPRTSHPELLRLAQLLPSVLLSSRKQSTLAQYASPWNRWAAFAARTGVSALPASPAHLALYLVSLLQTAATPSPLENTCAAIFAYHDSVPWRCPTCHSIE